MSDLVVVSEVDPRTLPHSEESERAVLAAVLLDPERHLAPTAGRLDTADFYFERHQKLWDVVLDLHDQGSSIDLRTIQAMLEQRTELELVGGIYEAGLDMSWHGRVHDVVVVHRCGSALGPTDGVRS